jgi:hypothetical protein
MSVVPGRSWSLKRLALQPTNFQAYERAGSMVRQFYNRPAIQAAGENTDKNICATSNRPPVF